jgi:hypothetical protein
MSDREPKITLMSMRRDWCEAELSNCRFAARSDIITSCTDGKEMQPTVGDKMPEPERVCVCVCVSHKAARALSN